MISIVLTFALISAVFEGVLLMWFFNDKWLRKGPVQAALHISIIGANMAIHWGTIVGTMTALTSGLVSFAVIPAIIWIKVYQRARKNQAEAKASC